MDSFDLKLLVADLAVMCAIRAAQLGLKTACVESKSSEARAQCWLYSSKSLLNLSENFHKAKKDFNNQGIEVRRKIKY